MLEAYKIAPTFIVATGQLHLSHLKWQPWASAQMGLSTVVSYSLLLRANCDDDGPRPSSTFKQPIHILHVRIWLPGSSTSNQWHYPVGNHSIVRLTIAPSPVSHLVSPCFINPLYLNETRHLPSFPAVPLTPRYLLHCAAPDTARVVDGSGKMQMMPRSLLRRLPAG